jgi:hypothetical protein
MDAFMDKRMPPCQAAYNLTWVDGRWHNAGITDRGILVKLELSQLVGRTSSNLTVWFERKADYLEKLKF